MLNQVLTSWLQKHVFYTAQQQCCKNIVAPETFADPCNFSLEALKSKEHPTECYAQSVGSVQFIAQYPCNKGSIQASNGEPIKSVKRDTP